MNQSRLTVDIDTIFDLLADSTRRRLLYYLREHGTATRSELVDVVTGWAATDCTTDVDGRDSGLVTADDWTRNRVTLHHTHLPKLVDSGLVTDDDETAVVRLGEVPPWVEQCLDTAFEADQSLAEVSSERTEARSDNRT